jgi:hypothetical protein
LKYFKMQKKMKANPKTTAPGREGEDSNTQQLQQPQQQQLDPK